MITVYAPQNPRKKKVLWNNLASLIINFNGLSIVLRNLNEVRYPFEILGSTFSKQGASVFNDFKFQSGLCELPMGGKRFTRINKHGSKLSKIDRILVSHHFIHTWANAQLLALPIEFSDHCPLFLKSSMVDFGPIPFKFFNSWLLNGDINNIDNSSWNRQISSNLHPSICFKNKLKSLKVDLKAWRKEVVLKDNSTLKDLKSKVDTLDEKSERGVLCSQDKRRPVDIHEKHS